jgi:hypothetical protein
LYFYFNDFLGEVKPYKAFEKFKKYVGKNLEIKEDEPEPEDLPKDLVASIAQRKGAFDDLTARLEAKYGGKGGEEGEGGVKKKKKVAPATRGTRKGAAAVRGKRGAQKKKVKEVEEEEDEVVSEGEEMEA